MNLQKIQCQNCDTLIEATYCPQCGQKYSQPRLTLKVLADIAIQSVADLDRGFLHTCKELFRNPHLLIHNYLEGKRIIYTNPIKFLLIWLGVNALLSFSVLDIDGLMKEFLKKQITGNIQLPKTVKNPAVLETYTQSSIDATLFFMHNQQLIYVGLLPLSALFLYFFFRKQQYYFTEHLTIVTYSYGLYHIIALPLLFVYVNFPEQLQTISLSASFLMCVFLAYIPSKVYALQASFWKCFVKAFFAQLLCYIVYFIFIGISANAYAIYTVAKLK
jgi:hypothetical protein